MRGDSWRVELGGFVEIAAASLPPVSFCLEIRCLTIFSVIADVGSLSGLCPIRMAHMRRPRANVCYNSYTLKLNKSPDYLRLSTKNKRLKKKHFLNIPFFAK